MKTTKFTLTKFQIWLRGALITGAAVLMFLNNDPTFRQAVPPLILTITGAVAVGAIALRGFIDKSPSQGEEDQGGEVS